MQTSRAINFLIRLQGAVPDPSTGSDSGTAYLGEIIRFGGSFALNGGARCEGQTLSVAQNSAPAPMVALLPGSHSMRCLLPILACVLTASTTFAAEQATNYNQSDDGAHNVNPANALATGFVTGPANSWLFGSVSLTVEYWGIGETTLHIQLRSHTPNWGPGGVIETLASYPLATGVNNLSVLSNGAVLAPSTQYYIVLIAKTAGTSVRYTNDTAECSMTGWTINDYTNISTIGWPALGGPIRMIIDAAPIVPAPIVTSVTGCTDTPPKTINCPNSGGVNMVITGQNLTPDTVILIGGVPAVNQVYQSSTQINCTLPPGAGRNNPVTAVKGTQVGLLVSGVSYVAPACPGDANGDGVVNFQDVTMVLSSFTAMCP